MGSYGYPSDGVQKPAAKHQSNNLSQATPRAACCEFWGGHKIEPNVDQLLVAHMHQRLPLQPMQGRGLQNMGTIRSGSTTIGCNASHASPPWVNLCMLRISAVPAASNSNCSLFSGQPYASTVQQSKKFTASCIAPFHHVEKIFASILSYS